MSKGILAPKGYSAAGAFIGIKKEKKDLSIVVSDVPAVFAGVFTKNIVKAAPVLWDLSLREGGKPVRAFLTNSGNANACTGERGESACRAMAGELASLIGESDESVLVCSTGVIGVPLPLGTVLSGIRATHALLGRGQDSADLAAEAIMTTDTFPKCFEASATIGGKAVTIGGMAKGSGMIHPNMATLLAFLTTDCAISRELLQKALSEAVRDSFNMISVDGDTSTNDTLLIMANGLAENPEITEENNDYHTFLSILGAACRDLAIKVARDGEGATRLLEASVTGAKDTENARAIAKAVVSSSLFKAAIFGADANWGRVLCAMGYSGGEFNVNAVTIAFRSVAEDGSQERLLVMRGSSPVPFDEDFAKALLSRDTIYVDILLGDGDASATAWGCDLTYDYVKINGDYRS